MEHRTPCKNSSNILESFPRELRDAVNKRNNLQVSPFCLLPNNYTTPPSRFVKIRNPFEAAINDQLHRHIFSPTVFTEVHNPRTSEKFKWSIDDFSKLRPAQIDESTIAQFEQSSAEDDARVQAKIDKETHIVPSPFTQEIQQKPLVTESHSLSLKNVVETKETCNVWTQTSLSLPPNLPEALEKALLPYFTFTEDQRRQTVDLNSSLCRRLFQFDADSESSVSVAHSDISVTGSPVMEQKDSDKRKRNYDSSPENSSHLLPPELSPIPSSTPRKLSNCPISPINNVENVQYRAPNSVLQSYDSLSPIGQIRRSISRSFAKADFSGHMSVDNSFNLAPENEFLASNNTNLSESPVRSNEFMENSCNWDLEYNNICINTRPTRRSLFDARQIEEKMDISNLTTPKSKIINSQRKKLSDSFRLNESYSDDEILHVDEQNIAKYRKHIKGDKTESGNSKTTEDNFTLSQNTQDTGYNTCTESTHKLNNSKDEENYSEDDIIMSEPVEQEEKENWNSNIYASTPTKRYFSNLCK